MNELHDHPAQSRREFLRRTAAAGLAVSVAGGGAFAAAADVPGTGRPAPPAAPAAPAAAPADSASRATPGPSEDARALADLLRRRFPDRLTDEQWQAVTRSLDQRLESGRRLRAAKLANADEPDFTFRP